LVLAQPDQPEPRPRRRRAPTDEPADTDTNSESPALERGVALFQKGDYVRATPQLEQVHADFPDDPDVDLLLGICYFNTDKKRKAEPLLRVATTSQNAETVAAARMFLGLIAREHGENDKADALFRKVAQDSSGGALSQSARALLRGSGAEKVGVLLLVRPEYDSNVLLKPTTVIAADNRTRDGDGDLLLLGALTYRPFSGGLALRETVSYRQQFTLLDLNVLSNDLALRYDYKGRDLRFSAAGAFDVMTLGSDLYTLGGQFDGGTRLRLASEFGIAARYTFRDNEFLPPQYAPYSGTIHNALFEAGWGVPEQPLEVSLGVIVLRENTNFAPLSADGLGGRAALRRNFGNLCDAQLAGQLVHRDFTKLMNAADAPDGVLARKDDQITVDAALSFDLSPHLGLFLGGQVLRNFSNAPDFDYFKMTFFAGLALFETGR
jgi:hypothetical protein